MTHLKTSPLLVVSPHADDAVLSCGGLLHAHPDATVVTVCSGEGSVQRPERYAGLASPPRRRQEDRVAMEALECEHHELDVLDAVDRRGAEGTLLYRGYAALFATVARCDLELVSTIKNSLQTLSEGRVVVCPLGIGAHVDHQLASLVGLELASQGHEVWFYEDAPYVYPAAGKLPTGNATVRWRALGVSPSELEQVPISLEEKAKVVACYSSQVQALFGDIQSYMSLARQYLGGTVEQFHRVA